MNFNLEDNVYECKIEVVLDYHAYSDLPILCENTNNTLFLRARFTHSHLYMIFYELFTFVNYSFENKIYSR